MMTKQEERRVVGTEERGKKAGRRRRDPRPLIRSSEDKSQEEVWVR